MSNQDRASNKTERVGLRTTSDQKELLERAAALQGESVSGFVLSEALDTARSVIREHQTIELSRQEFERFLTVLDEEHEPNAALSKAADRYRDWFGEGDE